jgi:hypothetical protein
VSPLSESRTQPAQPAAEAQAENVSPQKKKQQLHMGVFWGVRCSAYRLYCHRRKLDNALKKERVFGKRARIVL